jgi:hypothetical protein
MWWECSDAGGGSGALGLRPVVDSADGDAGVTGVPDPESERAVCWKADLERARPRATPGA